MECIEFEFILRTSLQEGNKNDLLSIGLSLPSKWQKKKNICTAWLRINVRVELNTTVIANGGIDLIRLATSHQPARRRCRLAHPAACTDAHLHRCSFTLHFYCRWLEGWWHLPSSTIQFHSNQIIFISFRPPLNPFVSFVVTFK